MLLLLLLLLSKFYVVLNQLRSQLAFYRYRSNSLLIIYSMLCFEFATKLLITFVNPNEIRVEFLHYHYLDTGYYSCNFDFEGPTLLIMVFFQIFLRIIIIIIIVYLYLFIKKTSVDYYPAQYITMLIIGNV